MTFNKNNMFVRYLRYLRYFKLFLRANREEDNKYLAFNVITRIGKKLLPQYRFTFPELEWWRDSDFNAYLERFGELGGYNTHRKWLLKQLLRMVCHIEGDTVECGTFRGASSWLILQGNTNARTKKIHHIFDSFEGLSDPGSNDGSHWNKGNLTVGMKELESNLLPFVNGNSYKLHKGWIPVRFHEVENKLFSFVHVDVDLYQPTFDSIQFFYHRLSEGGIFLCDDYGFDTCPGATKAVDEFLFDKNEKIIYLPDGGGFFIKGTHTSPE